MNLISLKLTFAALFVLALGTFVSVSFSAVSHILFVIPGLYFFYLDFIKKERPIHFSVSSKFLLVMVATMILSVLANTDIIDRPLSNISKVKYFLIPWLGVFAVQRLIDDYLTPKRARILLNTFLIATSIATVSGLIALKTGFNPIKMKDACHPSRACGLFGMYMTYGYGISLFATLLTVSLLLKNKFLSVKIIIPSTVLAVIGTILSYARGGWIGYIAGVSSFFFRKNTKVFLIFLAISASIFAGVLKFSPTVNNMFFNRAESNSQRIAFYKTAYIAFREKPFFGWGYRNFESNVKEIKKKHDIAYPEFGGHAHNNLLEHLASTGGLGFLATIAFFMAWLFESYRRDDFIGKVTFSFVVSFLVSGMFQYTFGDGENLFLIMGIWMLSQLRGNNVRLD
ncbi:O-antigen ligase [Halobacteriovorax sp. HLS]|uniref:O-antigen ligase family protein n=1 Tax=Halobacteriovorax sp. HLS TaxID=2234000 RepID=UPI000FDC337E|nr:O-antigen ligase family protein [Halobacteriovorax sp. HLS]